MKKFVLMMAAILGVQAGLISVSAYANPCSPYIMSVGRAGDRYESGRGCTSDNTPYGIVARSIQTAEGKTAEARVESLNYPADKTAIDAAAFDLTANGFNATDGRFIRRNISPLLVQAANASTDGEKQGLEKQATDKLESYLATRARTP